MTVAAEKALGKDLSRIYSYLQSKVIQFGQNKEKELIEILRASGIQVETDKELKEQKITKRGSSSDFLFADTVCQLKMQANHDTEKKDRIKEVLANAMIATGARQKLLICWYERDRNFAKMYGLSDYECATGQEFCKIVGLDFQEIERKMSRVEKKNQREAKHEAHTLLMDLYKKGLTY